MLLAISIILLAVVLGIVTIKYTFLCIDIFYQDIPNNTFKKGFKNEHINWCLYCIIMVCMSPYLILLDICPVLKDKWILAHKNSIKRVFSN